VKVAVVLHPRPGEDAGGGAFAGQGIILAAEAARRHHAEVDHLMAILARAIQHHRPAAADATHPWLQHAQRHRGRDHGIDAVAAGGQYLRADFRRFPRLRGDDATFGGHRRFADLLGVIELVAHILAFADVVLGKPAGRQCNALRDGAMARRMHRAQHSTRCCGAARPMFQ
jgi:hypothetical protein